MIKFNTYVYFGENFISIVCDHCGSKLIRSNRKDRIHYFLEHVCWKCLRVQPDIELMMNNRVDRLEYHFCEKDTGNINAES
jgi:hypothetical protein